VNVSCNDVATSGNAPQFCETIVLLPENATQEEAEQVFRSADRAAKELKVSIVGGHTETTPGLNRPIVICTSFCVAKSFVASCMAKPGERILMTKAAGLEGTSILSGSKKVRSKLGSRIIKRAECFRNELSIVKEAVLAASTGSVSAMHDCTEGGVLGAVFEMAHASGIGFVLEREKVPIRNETKEICKILGIDPLKLISSGSLLISTKEPESVIKNLSDVCDCSEVGYFTDRGMILVERGKNTVVTEPPQDELWKFVRKY
jgi:hydrogenase expression/formation protein HypE